MDRPRSVPGGKAEITIRINHWAWNRLVDLAEFDPNHKTPEEIAAEALEDQLRLREIHIGP